MTAHAEIRERLAAGENVSPAELVEAEAAERLAGMRADTEREQAEATTAAARTAAIVRVAGELHRADVEMAQRLLDGCGVLTDAVEELGRVFTERDQRIRDVARELHELGAPAQVPEIPGGASMVIVLTSAINEASEARGHLPSSFMNEVDGASSFDSPAGPLFVRLKRYLEESDRG